TSLGKTIALLKEKYRTMILDTTNERFAEIGKEMSAYISNEDQLVGIKNDLVAEVNDRVKEGITEPKWLIYIPDFKGFTQVTMMTEYDIRTLMKGTTVGNHFIFSGEYNDIGPSYELIHKYFPRLSVTGIVAMRLGDQDLYKQR